MCHAVDFTGRSHGQSTHATNGCQDNRLPGRSRRFSHSAVSDGYSWIIAIRLAVLGQFEPILRRLPARIGMAHAPVPEVLQPKREGD
jgi:hypothetical protein